MVRDHGHVLALEQAAMAAATSATPHRRKQRIPPGPAARAAAEALRHPDTVTGLDTSLDPSADQSVAVAGTDTKEVIVDLARYAAAAEGRNTLT